MTRMLGLSGAWVKSSGGPLSTSKHTCTHVCCASAGLDYTRPAFGPCTAPGVPAATCKVVYAEDLAPDDNQLDESTPGASDQFHGTNVAGIIASEYIHCLPGRVVNQNL